MNSWGFLRHNCVTQEAQLLAIFIGGSCWARVCFSKSCPSPSSRRVSPATAAPLASRAFRPPHARQSGRGPTAEAPHPPPRARDGGGQCSSPPPHPLPRNPAFSWEATALYCTTIGMTPVPANKNASLQVRPAPCGSSGSFPLTPESLPKRENRHEEGRGCRPPLLRQHPRVPAARRQPRIQLLQLQLMPPSPAAPTWQGAACPLGQVSPHPQPRGRRPRAAIWDPVVPSLLQRERKQRGLGTGTVQRAWEGAGSRGQGYEGGLRTVAFPVPAILRELRPPRPGPGKPLPRLHAGTAGSSSLVFCSWDGVLGLVTTTWMASNQPP